MRRAVRWSGWSSRRPCLLTVTTYAMWWAGIERSGAVPRAAAAAAGDSGGVRVGGGVARCAFGDARGVAHERRGSSAVMAGGGDGRLGYHTRNEGGMTAAPWLEWANRVVDLPTAAPAFVPQPVQPDPGGRVSRCASRADGIHRHAAVDPALAGRGVRRRVGGSIAVSVFPTPRIAVLTLAARERRDAREFGGLAARRPRA